MTLAVVLVEPAGPLNVGSVARLCANFDVDELRLVAPRCDHLGEEARRMAVHGEALLERAQLFPTLEAALADAEELLLEVGFLYPHTAQARLGKVRALLQRAEIRDEEVALLRGMVRQLRWASRRDCP